MKNKITGIIAIVLGVLIGVGPQFLFKICGSMDGEIPKCYYTGQAEIYAGAAIVLLGILLIVLKSSKSNAVLSFILATAGVLALLFPTAITGVCNDDAMSCALYTKPALIVLGILTAALGLIYGIYLIRQNKK